jgi:WD40 repeat protein
MVHQFTGHTQAVRKVTFSADGQFVISGGFDQRAMLWALHNTTGLPEFHEENSSVAHTSLSPDGLWMAAGRSDGSAALWNAVSGELMHTFQANSEPVWGVQFAAGGDWLVTGSDTLRVWKIEEGSLLRGQPALFAAGA